MRRLRGPSLKQNALPRGAKTAPMTSSAAPNIEDVAIVVVTLTPAPQAAARYSSADLTRLAHELQVEVAKLPDIGLTYIVGQQPEEIQVEPDPNLGLFGLTGDGRHSLRGRGVVRGSGHRHSPPALGTARSGEREMGRP